MINEILILIVFYHVTSTEILVKYRAGTLSRLILNQIYCDLSKLARVSSSNDDNEITRVNNGVGCGRKNSAIDHVLRSRALKKL